eukprot:TRINITY_DN56039_c0_g1_i1.p1 TRINITY_DN56039_c0_g1~~TRINITY_DN56039_c0_g1_i1.p1  ORF type:complete len:606 (-),score=64.37 TRINITY_DN56039_c0_g1_i1:75-1892(-)
MGRYGSCAIYLAVPVIVTTATPFYVFVLFAELDPSARALESLGSVLFALFSLALCGLALDRICVVWRPVLAYALPSVQLLLLLTLALWLPAQRQAKELEHSVSAGQAQVLLPTAVASETQSSRSHENVVTGVVGQTGDAPGLKQKLNMAPNGAFLHSKEIVRDGRISVVLPCAAEGEFMLKTVQSFCARTPPEVLREIIVVDDGSTPPLDKWLQALDRPCPVRMLRHKETLGLMVAKQTGGDAAVGEYIGFFDCHVAPNVGWHEELRSLLASGPRRLAVPYITDLDVDRWDEKEHASTYSKCYIDFNADFMWFDDDSNYIPVISGGLVAISNDWWRESGGFDKLMRGWGGENVDQSLRTWLCGGEILRARSSRIAHMFRVPEDKRTEAHYKRISGTNNIARVAAGWFDEFRKKYKQGYLEHQALDVSNIIAVKERLQCKPFAFFLHRFRSVYRDGGLLPEKVFRMKSSSSGLCVHRGSMRFQMRDCSSATWFHQANQDPSKGGKCCSGIRQWNSMDCMDRLDDTGPIPYFCDITGKNQNQLYRWDNSGVIRHGQSCLSQKDNHLAPTSCDIATIWSKVDAFSPEETGLYEAAVKRYGFSESTPSN